MAGRADARSRRCKEPDWTAWVKTPDIAPIPDTLVE